MVQKLNGKAIKEAAKLFEGEHDFLSFTTNKKTRTSIKKIFSLDVTETNEEIIFTMKANGFLLNMERIIVGTLIQIGLGQLPMNSIEKAFESRNMNGVGRKAMVRALYL